MKIIFPKTHLIKSFLALALGGVGAILQAADFTVVNNGFSSYTINGQSNPGLTLRRGTTYTFSVSASSHPFYIKTVQGNTTANAYGNGVTGNGVQTGTLTFAVPANAPSTLFYDCSIHTAMTGTITVVDPPVPPVPQILKLTVGTNLDLKFTASNAFSYFPEFNTNLATTNWFALTIVQTNASPNGTNDVICGRPAGNNIFIRVRAQ